MRVAVTGGTGFIGRALVRALLERGDEVRVVTRRKGKLNLKHPNLTESTWEEWNGRPERLEGTDAIVNLAGETINQRWTKAAKDRVLKSRLDAAGAVAEWVRAMRDKPVVVNASGISYYGMSETETFDERSPGRVTDFLSAVVKEWEEAADRIPARRLVKLRVGLVLGADGGAFPLMVLPYRLFVGGRVGSGRQWISWIHIEDMTRLILFCLDNEHIAGPVNASAPEPVTNDRFGRAVAAALGRPHWFPVPAALMRLVFGELSVLLLEGQRALPNAALEAGFTFRYPTIDEAVRQLLDRQSL
ncbi:MAG: TIGR01777 family protein [Thermobacillus sp. ZCTH02-B1]|uniref:TIGR01777 family oxidoreductase n=1 Tax=Thermobacillus sp. ZCTH02-B1 TaxID=1858795 RepID=UPI000B5754C5|nr:TIGR01777 family oxidoreductase [Thermobacillus sp. ZCTH02-B1]OUM94590.1 MAG: TIGR01777 family protein [Thermobacillus sp. ZCTH02-B1]